MRFILLLIFGISSYICISQDTLSIYFDFGSSKVSENQISAIEKRLQNWDLSASDSISFTGLADSVGNFKSNIRLSEKRAKKVHAELKRIIPSDIPYSIWAIGEGTANNDSINRRVDIIIYETKFPVEQDEVIENVDPSCFQIDVQSLSYCHVEEVTYRKKEMVQLQTQEFEYFKSTKHYYATKNEDGTTDISKLKWKKKRTGKLWWKKQRLTAYIPVQSYKDHQYFTLYEPPCDSCSIGLLFSDSIKLDVIQFYSDNFLMQNMQIKTRFFGLMKTRFRAPKEYVDTTAQYYFQPWYGTTVDWYSKKRKKHRDYLFTKYKIRNENFGFYKTRQATICTNACTQSHFRCLHLTDRDFGCSSSFGLSSVFQQKEVLGLLFLSAKIYNGPLDLRARIGLNTQLGLYGSGKLTYHFISFPIYSSRGQWQHLDDFKKPKFIGDFNGGIEFKTNYDRKDRKYNEVNAHLGLDFYIYKWTKLNPTLAVYGGIANDLSNTIPSNFYPFGQIDITFTIFNIKMK